jgi:hypothetical protein
MLSLESRSVTQAKPKVSAAESAEALAAGYLLESGRALE